MILACICGGILEIGLLTLVVSILGFLCRKIKNWKCCCKCHDNHEEHKDETSQS